MIVQAMYRLFDRPSLSDAECVGVDSLRDVNALGHLVDSLQGTLR